MSRPGSWIVHAGLLVLFGLPSPPLAGQEQDVVLRSTTRLLTLDVVVRDKEGRPVLGLKEGDFSVMDNGKPQVLRVFRAAAGASADAANGAANAVSSGAALRMGLPAELPPEIHTNFEASKGLPAAVSVILFDGLNTSIVDQRYARAQILKFLEQLQPTDRIGLYILGQKLHILHDFTTDAESLLRQLKSYKGELLVNTSTESSLAPLLNDAKLEKILTDGGEQERAESQIVADQNVAVLRLRGRVEKTYRSLEAIAQHLAPIPGRKNLIWVSAAFPAVVSTDIRTGTGSPETFAYLADRAARAIASAGVAVYPVDARGVMVDLMYAGEKSYKDYAMARVVGQSRSRGSMKGPRGSFSSPDPLAYNGRDETVSHHDTMKDIAQRTGGKAFYSSNDSGRSVREAIEDGAGSYTLGYYPSDYADDGRYRKVVVKLARSGVSVFHREGYYANESQPIRDQQQREAMWELMASPLEAQAVPFAVQTEVLLDEGGAGKAGKLKLVFRIDPEAVSLREEKGRWMGKLEIVLVYRDALANSKGGAEQVVPLNLSASERDMARGSGFTYQIALPHVAEASQLLIGVRDAPSGRIGTLRIAMNSVPR